jgi:hypothetical protein
MPAFREFPIINVVHPAYQAFPNGGHGSFAASGNLRFNCVLVFATKPSTSQPESSQAGTHPCILQNAPSLPRAWR